VVDIAPLSGLVGLMTLNLQRTQIVNLAPLLNLPRVKALFLPVKFRNTEASRGLVREGLDISFW